MTWTELAAEARRHDASMAQGEWSEWEFPDDTDANYRGIAFARNNLARFAEACEKAAGYDALDAERDELAAKLAYLKSCGLTVGTMKEAGKEPRLSYAIERGSELCDMRAVDKLTDAQAENARLTTEVAELRRANDQPVTEEFLFANGFVYLSAFKEYEHPCGLRYHAPISGTPAYWSFGNRYHLQRGSLPTQGHVLRCLDVLKPLPAPPERKDGQP